MSGLKTYVMSSVETSELQETVTVFNLGFGRAWTIMPAEVSCKRISARTSLTQPLEYIFETISLNCRAVMLPDLSEEMYIPNEDSSTPPRLNWEDSILNVKLESGDESYNSCCSLLKIESCMAFIFPRAA